MKTSQNKDVYCHIFYHSNNRNKDNNNDKSSSQPFTRVMGKLTGEFSQ